MVEGPMRYVAKGAARSAGGAFSLVCWAVRGLLLATDRPFAALRRFRLQCEGLRTRCQASRQANF